VLQQLVPLRRRRDLQRRHEREVRDRPLPVTNSIRLQPDATCPRCPRGRCPGCS
jgi:hypothetical protein